MSSRSGDVIEVRWLFDQIAAAIEERGSEAEDTVMSGAMRYQFLKVRIGSDVIFDVDEASSIQGNSGPYLQYAHARACSVVAKATERPGELKDLTEDEHELVLKISEYQEVLQRAVGELRPHHLCNYLYELTQVFNRFYEKNRIIGDSRQSQRLAILTNYRAVLGQGLDILGIPAPEKM
jgi:arginyl-tRNA synthetase